MGYTYDSLKYLHNLIISTNEHHKANNNPQLLCLEEIYVHKIGIFGQILFKMKPFKLCSTLALALFLKKLKIQLHIQNKLVQVSINCKYSDCP